MKRHLLFPLILLSLLSLLLIPPLVETGHTAPDASISAPAPPGASGSTDASLTDTKLIPDPLAGTKPPGTIPEGADTARTLWQAIKDKAWWLAAACGVFLIMLALQLFKLFDRMGKRATWIVAGALSFIAALLLAFDKSGFSWDSFLAFATAGPTIAWVRGFIKKAVLNFQKT